MSRFALGLAIAVATTLVSGLASAQNVTCMVTSTPDVPSSVVVKNAGPSAVSAGQYTWTVVTSGLPNKTGAVPALAAGKEVTLSHVLGSGQVGTCSVKANAVPALSDKGPVVVSSKTLPVVVKITCLVATTPDVLSSVVLKNEGPIAVAAGKYTWTVVTSGKPNKSGAVPALAAGQQLTLPHVLGSGQVGTCSVK